MKSMLAFLYTVCMVMSGCSNNNSTDSQDPGTTESHFEFILYDDLSQSVVAPIRKKLEENYMRILNEFDIEDMPDVKVKVWNNEQHYLDDQENDIGQRFPGSTGYVYGPAELRILYTANAPQTAHHEFAHVVSLNVKSNFANNPRWLWEAVAIYESGEFINPQNISYIASGNYPTISELNSSFNNNRKIYEVGYTISEYILTTWGKEKFVSLIKSNGNIQSTLNIPVAEFETGWHNFIRDKYF